MKKYILPTALILLAFCAVLVLSVDDSAFAKANQKQTTSEKLPIDYMFMQRAYPSGEIKSGAYREAALWKKEFQETRTQHQDVVWEFTGPLNIGGRITDIEISTDASNIIYVGAASGGIFRSIDNGGSWQPVFDEQPVLSIGDIALAPSDQDIVYVGTGEVNAGGGSLVYDGDGVYRSDDAGVSWENIGLRDVGSIGKILVDPTDPDVIYVGAMGPLFLNDGNRGVYKTTDAGENWEQVLFIGDMTGVVDMAIDPTNPDVVYAAVWERERTRENRIYGGPTSGIYKTTDGGATWNELTAGLPSAGNQKGRISIDIAQSNPAILYASYANASGGIQGFFKTEDAGSTWNSISTSGVQDVGFHWWFGGLFINPENPDEVYHVGFDMDKTTDGGASWQPAFPGVHVDQHALAFMPGDPSQVLLGNDGGLYTSSNSGVSSVFDATLPITQFYRFYVDPSDDQRIYGGAQDNSTMRTTTGGLSDWTIINGGDGFQPLVNKDDGNTMYALSQRGNLRRSTNDAASFQTILNGIDPADRNNWDTPIAFDPQDNNVLYYGTQRVYQSTNGGTSWAAISPDLTNGPSSGNLAFGTLTSIDVSPLDSDIIYAGSDDGNIWSTTDGGTNWNNISGGLPNFWVTRVKASASLVTGVYATFSGYRYGEDDGHIFLSTDSGATWSDDTLNLPDIPVNDVEIDGFDNVYLATDIGVFVRATPTTWEPFGANLPSVVVNDLHFDNASGFLYAGTYGRSSYKVDVSSDILSVDENLAFEVTIFPNPASEYFMISSHEIENGKVHIYNQLGQLQRIFEWAGNAGKYQIDDLAKGVYIVQIQSGDRALSQKLILK